jgi:hypothetical protein
MNKLCRFTSRRLKLLLLAVAYGAFCSEVSHGQSWVTADNYSPDSNYLAFGTTICVGGSSNVYAAGTITTTTGDFGERVYGVVRRSTNAGASWDTVDSFPDWWEVKASTVSPAGTVVVVGQARTNSEMPRWLVRLSADGASNWRTVDEYEYAPGQQSGAVAVVAGNDGTIYVGGWANGTSAGLHWVVRRSVDKGLSWNTVADETSTRLSPLMAMCRVKAGLFLTGFSSQVASNQTIESWRIKRNTDNSAAWSDVDTWLASGSFSCQALGIAEDRNGILLAAGVQRFDGGNHVDLVVRRSVDGGNTWTTSYVLNNGGFPKSVVAAVSGAVFLASDWFIRVTQDGGLTWTGSNSSIPDYPYGAGAGMTTDAVGNIYVVGNGYKDGVRSRWIVRKLAAQPQSLSVRRQGIGYELSWPAFNTGFVLQAASALFDADAWHDSATVPITTNDQRIVTINPTGPTSFFRLRKP